MNQLMIEALTAEDNKFRCFRHGKKWFIMRGAHRIARVDRGALALAVLRAHLAYGKETQR